MSEQKISVISDEFGEMDFEKVAEYLSTNDFEYVELRNVWKKSVFHLDEMDIQEIKDILNKNGLKVSSISGGLLKTTWPGPPGERETMKDGTPIIDYQMEMADNCIKIADAFNVKFIRAFGFRKLAFFADEMWKDWMEALKLLVNKAEKNDKIIIIENEHGCIFSDVASIKKTFEEVDSENCKLLFDPGNLVAGGELINNEVFKVVKDITGYIHVKDAIIESKKPWRTSWCIIDQGDVGWREIIDFFIDYGYNSFWSVETHMGKGGRWNNTVENLKVLRSLLN